MIDSYLGLGANLGDALGALRGAHQLLIQHPDVIVTGTSAIYKTAPVGPPGQDDYLNAAIAIRSNLNADRLLDVLQHLEHCAGRQRLERWGPRTLDVDLLLYGSEVIDSPRLTVPHPRLFERNFVLLPLRDLLPDEWTFPDGSVLSDRVQAAPQNPIDRTDLAWTEHAAPGQMRA
ncbi:MAG: 2-amino-4-hydroxy-6-hydroxymethyldihydropteridine diphosphokinase [Pseudomonadota bacterium]